MKMIDINLYPYQESKEKQVFAAVLKYVPFVFIGLGVLIVVNIVLFLATSFSVVSHNNLKRKWEEMGPQAKGIETLKSDIMELKKKEKNYKNLFTHRAELSHVFADLFAALPKNVWLDDITYAKDNLTIVAYVVEWKENDFSSTINAFIQNLQSKEYFSKVFKNINPKGRRILVFNAKKVMRFEVECAN